MKVTWLETLDPKQIALSISLFEKLAQPKELVINIGSFKISCNSILIIDLAEDTFGLPKNISQIYTIPTDIPYECYVNGNEIHLGPLISLIDLGDLKELKDKIYYSIIPKFIDYDSIKGLVILCSEDSIDLDNETIEGYYYDPFDKAHDGLWKYGKFPLPNVFYNRSLLSLKKISLVKKKLGNNLFNTYMFNLSKLVIWKTLSKNENLLKYLPYTEKYHGADQIVNLLNQYTSIYLKPCRRSQGIGIMKINKEKEGFLVVNNKAKRFYFSDIQSLTKSLNKILTIPYIIQQSVAHKINNQHVDFRVIIQKDATMNWIFAGLMGRIVPEGVIITNRRGNSITTLGRTMLTTHYGLDNETAEKIEEEVTKITIKAVTLFEEKGLHLGDIAADFILDSNLNIWLLELQFNHAIYGNTNALPHDFFNKVITNPFQYAKTLGGFYDIGIK